MSTTYAEVKNDYEVTLTFLNQPVAGDILNMGIADALDTAGINWATIAIKPLVIES